MKPWIAIAGLLLILVTAGCINAAPPKSNTTADGTVIQPDGTMVKADGTMVKVDGTMIKPDGTMIKPDGTMIKVDGTMVKPDGTMIKPDGTMIGPDGTVIGDTPAGPAATEGNLDYVPFTLAAYNQAKAEGKTIFLEFYANWCPICQSQAPALKEGLESISSDKLVAFRVNYKDSETDADETAMAQKYNITYQHTHIVAGSDESVKLRSNESWSKADVIEKVGAFA
jgi:thiol-disulfide isomerase/thioredoxin